MLSINNRTWKAFKLIDLFEYNRGNQNKMNSLTDGDYPLVSAKNINNGLKAFVKENDKSIYDGNSMSLNNDGDGGVGIAYYQPHDYYLDSHCTALCPKNTKSRLVMLFLCASTTMQRILFSHGRSISEKRLKKIMIMLPSADNGQPDYAFMEEFIKEREAVKRQQYLDYCQEQLKTFGGGYSLIPLADKQWKSFFIGDLFSVKRPLARNKDDYEVGDIPFVASGSVNNGVMKCCKTLENEKLDEGGCITVSPVDGSAFYQPYSFLGRGGAGSSILILYSDNLNLYSGQFIAKMIANTCACKYSYGHMGNKDGIRRERIMLPVDENNNPDYQFMEKYSKNLLREKMDSYINYVRNIIS